MSDPATYHIRSATIADFDTIYGFVNALEETIFERDILYDIFQKNIASSLNIYLIASDLKHQPVGYISCHGQYLLHHAGLVGEIQELFVSPDKRGEGIGRLLVGAVKDRARHMGMVQLEVTANIKRVATHRFYEQQGFDQTHRKFVYPLIG
jgi:PhnO protein